MIFIEFMLFYWLKNITFNIHLLQKQFSIQNTIFYIFNQGAMLAKISTKEEKGNYHRDSVIRDLRAEIEQLQHQVKLIQSQNKENEKSSFQKKDKTKKANLVKVSERSWLSMKQIKNCIDALEEQLNIEPTVHIIVPYINSLLTAFEYQFERINGMLDDRDLRLIQQEKINFQIRQQYLQIQKKTQLKSYQLKQLHEQLYGKQLQLEQHISILKRSQQQFHSLKEELLKSYEIIAELDRQVQSREEKQHLYKAVQFQLNEKIDEARGKYKEIEEQKEYYKSYIQDMIIKIKRMEEEALLYKMQMSKWKLFNEDN